MLMWVLNKIHFICANASEPPGTRGGARGGRLSPVRRVTAGGGRGSGRPWAAVPTRRARCTVTGSPCSGPWSGDGDGRPGLSDRPWHDARRPTPGAWRPDIDLLLWRLRDHPDLAAFEDRAIGPLLDHDHRSRPPLLPTLRTYLAHAGRKAETARELHLNRQTRYNRLTRIGELLGTDLDDPRTVLELSLALRARRLVP